MANPIKKGFHPVESNRAPARIYTVASAYTPANSHPGIAPGEVVNLVTAGSLQVAAAGDTTLLGVVAWVKYKDTSGNIVTGSYLPAGYTYSGTTSVLNPLAPQIGVWDAPDIEYVANVTGAATTLALIEAGRGANMDINATVSTGVDTVFARSNRMLDGTYVAATAQFRILELFKEVGQDFAAINYRVRCMINEGFHAFTSAGGI